MTQVIERGKAFASGQEKQVSRAEPVGTLVESVIAENPAASKKQIRKEVGQRINTLEQDNKTVESITGESTSDIDVRWGLSHPQAAGQFNPRNKEVVSRTDITVLPKTREQRKQRMEVIAHELGHKKNDKNNLRTPLVADVAYIEGLNQLWTIRKLGYESDTYANYVRDIRRMIQVLRLDENELMNVYGNVKNGNILLNYYYSLCFQINRGEISEKQAAKMANTEGKQILKKIKAGQTPTFEIENQSITEIQVQDTVDQITAALNQAAAAQVAIVEAMMAKTVLENIGIKEVTITGISISPNSDTIIAQA